MLTGFFQKHRNSGKLADKKSCLTSNFLINPILRIFSMWLQMMIPQNLIQNLLTLLTLTRFCPCCTSTQTKLCLSGWPYKSHYSKRTVLLFIFYFKVS